MHFWQLKKWFVSHQTIVFTFSFLLMVGSMISMSLYAPSLPVLETELNISPKLIQMTVVCYFFGFCISQLCYGPIANYYGRRPVIIFSLIVCCIGSVAVALSDGWPYLFIGRFIQGIGSGTLYNTSRALLCDVYERHELVRMQMPLSMTVLVTPMVAPLFGGHIEHYLGWRHSFWFLGSYFLMLLIVYVIFFPETHPSSKQKIKWWQVIYKQYKQLFHQKEMLHYSFLASIPVCCIMAYIIITPFIIQKELELQPRVYGWLSLVVLLSFYLADRGIKLLKQRNWHAHDLLVCGLSVLCIGAVWLLTIAFADIETIFNLMIGIAIVLIGCKMISTNEYDFMLSMVQGGVSSNNGMISVIQSTITFLLSLFLTHFFYESTEMLGVVYLLLGGWGLYVVSTMKPKEIENIHF
jgi:MFS transporter, DHA1 family, 2-module integral membrane pump EmrD